MARVAELAEGRVEYEVLRPFTASGRGLRPGDRVPVAAAAGWRPGAVAFLLAHRKMRLVPVAARRPPREG